MHAHTHLSHKYVSTYIFMYNAYKYVYTRTSIYPVFRTRSYTYTRGHPRMRVPTRLHTHARIDDPPSASRPQWRAARAGKGGAYPEQRGDRGGVPRADVRVERRRLVERLRAEPSAFHADGTRSHVPAQMRARPITHAHTDAARTQHAGACVSGPASAIRSSG